MLATKKSMPVVLIVIVIAGLYPAAVQGVEIPEIAAAIVARQQRYVGLQFEYDAESRVRLADDAVIVPDPYRILENRDSDTRQVFALKRSTQEGDPAILRKWMVYTGETDADRVLRQFVAYDGAKSVFYQRAPQLSAGVWSRASIVPFELWDELVFNTFEQFLFSELMLASTYRGRLADGLREYEFQWARDDEWQGKQVHVLEGKFARFGTTYEVFVTPSPEAMVVRWETQVKGEQYSLYEIHTVGRYKDLPYPQSGSFRQSPGFGIGDARYSFQVASVADLTPETKSPWFPEWPTGTAIQDAINDTVTSKAPG